MALNFSIYSLLKKPVLHSLFWAAILVFFIFFFENNSTHIGYTSSFAAFLMPVTIATTYTVVYYLIPRFLLLKKYPQFILYSVYTLILSAYAIIISIFYGLIYLMNLNTDNMAPLGKSLLLILLVVYLVVVFVSGFTLLKRNYASDAKNKALQNKILEGQLKLKEQELHFLKMQVHPHFLFNTLNTIYGYSLEKGDETPDMILKLSNLLDYLLYQADKPVVTLSEEVAHLKEYMALEELRFRDTLSVSFVIPDSFEEIKIAPMLLIPFVENSFKHGDIINKKLTILLSLNIEKELLIFSLKNTARTKEGAKEKDRIGLENVKKRLEILYPNNYSFTTKNEGNWYEVNLSINHTKLSSNG